jgi:hypothetical protein
MLKGLIYMSYNVSDLNSWFVNLLHVFGVVNLKWAIYVVARIYYQKWGKGSESYMYLNNSNITYVDAHLVKVIKFSMTPQDHCVKRDDPIYKLWVEHEAMIFSTLRKDD